MFGSSQHVKQCLALAPEPDSVKRQKEGAFVEHFESKRRKRQVLLRNLDHKVVQRNRNFRSKFLNSLELFQISCLKFKCYPRSLILLTTPIVSNYRSFDFFNLKFDHSSYSKIYVKHHFFCCELFYQYKFFKSDLNLAMFAQNF